MKLILLGMALAYVLSGAVLALILFVGDRAQRNRRAVERSGGLGQDWVRWGPFDETAEEAVERIIEESRT